METIVLDTETTGLKAPKACQIAYIGLSKSPQELLEEDGLLRKENHTVFKQLYNPGKPIEAGAFAVHGISDEQVKNCPDWNSFAIPDTVQYVIGYKVSFDLRTLALEDSRLKFICMHKAAKDNFKGLEDYKLGTVIKYLQPALHKQITKSAHDALTDVKLTLLILDTLLRKREISTWEEAYDLWGIVPKSKDQSDSASNRNTVNFGKYKGMPYDSVPVDYLEWVVTKSELSVAIKNRCKAELELR